MADGRDIEGFGEDRVALHNSDASLPASGNKYEVGFDSVGSPGPQTDFPANPSFGENDFPRQTGHDSLSSDEALLT